MTKPAQEDPAEHAIGLGADLPTPGTYHHSVLTALSETEAVRVTR